ncbi:MAG: DUF502 domain-containing protein [Planctomycetes bacterium]|nr:DUF502 domain-containing protein [Planctomycetota bacterium]
MGFLSRLFFRGLAAILPLALTGGLIWWAVAGTEQMLHQLLLLIFDDEWVQEWYWAGLGLALSIVLVLTAGLLMYSFIVQQVYRRVTALLERIPVVKSVYGMIVDVVRLLGSPDERPFRKVVLVRVEDSFDQIGFLTRDGFDDMPGIGDGRVAVYLPMSYQLGGFTVIVEKAKVREIDMSVEEALRFCITAGVSKTGTG